MTVQARISAQRGAVIVTVCLMLFFLFGFIGIALDFSRSFIVKAELQTAMDTCALAAAQELDRQSTSIERATSAGITAGNLNRVNFQSPTWMDEGQITEADLRFMDEEYDETSDPLAAHYAECRHTQPAIRRWLLQAMGAFSGDRVLYPATGSVAARAVATRASAQRACPLPVAVRPKTSGCHEGNCGEPNYGFAPGEWVIVLGKTNADPAPGQMGWKNLDGTESARNTKDQLAGGNCNIVVGTTLSTHGAKVGVHDVWNYRFGVYSGQDRPAAYPPDHAGYSYTPFNWATQRDAWSDFRAARRPAHATYQGDMTVFGRRLLQNYQYFATQQDHENYGAARRLATVPVINAGNSVVDYLCVFMLHPLTGPNEDARLEILGNASDPALPCVMNGLPGGSAGPLVPVLVR